MSCCGFEPATGLYPETNTTPIDFTQTSNSLYTDILFYSNVNTLYSSNINSNLTFNINSNISNVNYNISNINSNNYGFSNLILSYINRDINSNIYFNNSNNTIINSNSILNVYHNANPLIIGDTSRYYNVEDVLTSNIIETNLLKFDFGLLQSALTSLTSFLSTIQSELSALEASDVALTTSMVVIEQQIQSINAIIAGLDLTIRAVFPLENVNETIILNYNAQQFNLIDNCNLNIKSITQNIPSGRATFINGLLNKIDDNNAYIKFVEDGTITFTQTTNADVLVVAAGGRGGAGFYSGGGGAGEVIYKTNHSFAVGTYNIKIGLDSSVINNRISKIYQGGWDILKASGGGDGGFYDEIKNSIFNYYLFKPLVARVNNTNDYNLIEGGNKLIFYEGYIELNNIKDRSYPLISILPIYWYKFDVGSFLTNSGTIGSSGNLSNINSVTSNITTFIKGDSSASFNINNNQYLEIPNFNLNLRTIQSSTGFNISFWCQMSNITATTSTIFKIFNNSTPNDNYISFGKFTNGISNFLRLEIKTSGTSEFFTTTSAINYFTNKWYYFSFNFKSDNYIEFFINNELITSTWFFISNTTFNRFHIGSSFTGIIDDFRFYQSFLNTNQLKELYTGSIVINDMPQSGGSGGGGGGGQYSLQFGANFGIIIDPTISKVNSGFIGTTTEGGKGGSALANGGYIEEITGNDLIVGIGGDGNGDINYYPENKNDYGSGGDGNGGKAFQGVVIIKIPYLTAQTTFNGFTHWSNINNINTTIPISLSGNKDIQLNYDTNTLTLSGNNLKVVDNLLVTNPISKTKVGDVITHGLNYDTGTLTLSGNNLKVVDNLLVTNPISKTKVGDVITHGLNYDTGTLTLSGSNLKVIDNLLVNAPITKTKVNDVITHGLSYDSSLILDTNNKLKVVNSNVNYWISSNNNLYYNTGNIGIGISNPETILHLNASNIKTQIKFTNNFTGSNLNDGAYIGLSVDDFYIENKELYAKIIFRCNNNDTLIINDANVGIGVSNPQATLHLHRSTPLSRSEIRFTTLETGTTLNDGAFLGLNVKDFFIENLENDSRTVIKHGEDEKIIVENNQIKINNITATNSYVGIGISTPEQILQLHRPLTSARTQIKFSNDDTGAIEGTYVGLNGVGGDFYIDNTVINSKTVIRHAGSDRIALTANGDIGIHTLTPKSALTIYGNDNKSACLSICEFGNNRNPKIDFIRGFTDSGAIGSDFFTDWRIHTDSGDLKFASANSGDGINDRARITPSGSLVIGSFPPLYSPEKQLEVEKNLRVFYGFDVDYNNDTAFGAFINTNKPYFQIFAEDYDSSLNALIDSSGNNRHGYVTEGTLTRDASSGNGATANVTYLQGTTATKINFAPNSLPQNFTIASLIRFTTTNRAAILTAKETLFAHGFLQGQAGVAFYNWYITNLSGNVAPETNWAICIGKNEIRTTNFARNFRCNGQDRAIYGDGMEGYTGGATLTINDSINSTSIPPSDFAISAIMVWDKHITDTNILHIENAFQAYLNTGLSIKSRIKKAIFTADADFLGNNRLISTNPAMRIISTGGQTGIATLTLGRYYYSLNNTYNEWNIRNLVGYFVINSSTLGNIFIISATDCFMAFGYSSGLASVKYSFRCNSQATNENEGLCIDASDVSNSTTKYNLRIIPIAQNTPLSRVDYHFKIKNEPTAHDLTAFKITHNGDIYFTNGSMNLRNDGTSRGLYLSQYLAGRIVEIRTPGTFFSNSLIGDMLIKSGATYKLILQNDTNDTFVINEDKVGIYNNYPKAMLSVGDSSVTNSDGFILVSRQRTDSVYNANRMFAIKYDNNHRAVIGDAGNNNELGTLISQLRISYNAVNNACTISPDGNLLIVGSVQSISDQRLKTNIKTLENSLYKILNLRGVQYTRIQNGRREIGMLSQEVQHLIPELVEENEDGIKHLNYTSMIPILIESIKELNGIILNQATKINKLEEILFRNNLT